jgi:hypothetical protein
MSDIQAGDDPYEAHPLGALFIEHAFQAHEATGNPTIAPETAREIAAIFGLDQNQIAAHVSLARRRTGEILEDIELTQPTDAYKGDD